MSLLSRLMWIQKGDVRRSVTKQEAFAFFDEMEADGWQQIPGRRCISCRKRLGWWENSATGGMCCTRCGFVYPTEEEAKFTFFPDEGKAVRPRIRDDR